MLRGRRVELNNVYRYRGSKHTRYTCGIRGQVATGTNRRRSGDFLLPPSRDFVGNFERLENTVSGNYCRTFGIIARHVFFYSSPATFDNQRLEKKKKQKYSDECAGRYFPKLCTIIIIVITSSYHYYPRTLMSDNSL